MTNIFKTSYIRGREWIYIIPAIVAFWVICSVTADPCISDQHLYVYMGKLVMKGLLPYRDFYYSSPPLIPYIFGLLGKVAGWHWYVFLVIPFLLSAIDACAIYAILRSQGSSRGGVLAAWLYILSFCVLMTSASANDIHLIVTLLLCSVWALLKERCIVAGLLLSLAILCKIYAIIFCGSIILWLLARRQFNNALFAAGVMTIMVGLVFAFFYVLVGDEFLRQVIINNLGRSNSNIKIFILKEILIHDPWVVPIISMVLIFFFFKRAFPGLALMLGGAYILFFVIYPDIYFLYSKIFIAAIALMWGWIFMMLEQRFQPGRTLILTMVATIAAITFSIAVYFRDIDLNQPIRELAKINNLVLHITKPGEAIYGDYEITPLVALETGKSITGNLVETNQKFYQMGIFNLSQRSQAVIDSGTKTIISKAVIDTEGRILPDWFQVMPYNLILKYCPEMWGFQTRFDLTTGLGTSIIVFRCDWTGVDKK